MNIFPTESLLPLTVVGGHSHLANSKQCPSAQASHPRRRTWRTRRCRRPISRTLPPPTPAPPRIPPPRRRASLFFLPLSPASWPCIPSLKKTRSSASSPPIGASP
ncbi:hypothetical protein TorRG33x02_231950 [Trema orientale]|uniref:Uncharacterized protein n=1 Tax=Trema orientale TaxID=63057 RepID=A0A2P5E619_TREOI|nr:hypothetical protein TorRG33x02_231950 [Trema orientale]